MSAEQQREKKLEDYTSSQLLIYKLKLLQDYHENPNPLTKIYIEFITVLCNQKLKEEKDKTLTDLETTKMVANWLLYIREECKKFEDKQTTENIMSITIIKNNKELTYSLDAYTNLKLDFVTVYALLKHNYKVYRGTILLSYPNIDNSKLEIKNSYKEYISEYRTSFNQEFLDLAEEAFKRTYPLEKAELKVKQWLQSVEKITNPIPIGCKEHVIVIVNKGNNTEKIIYKLPKDEYIPHKTIWCLHMVGYAILLKMKIDDPLS